MMTPDFRVAAPILMSLLLVAGCTDYSAAPKSESAAVSRLLQQGFKMVSDGRGSDQPSALRYSGDPSRVILCGRVGGKYSATDQSKTLKLPNGLRAKESGIVDAYVVVENDGSRRGAYFNTVTREVRTKTGKLAGRQVEYIDFTPTGRDQFRNGLVCRARS